MQLIRKFSLRGDTLIEVSFAIAVFALVAMISITIMNTGVTMAERSLENTMTRNEVDAQAEALRFIQNSYLSEKELIASDQQYRDIWKTITNLAVSGSDIDKLPTDFNFNSNFSGCAAFYNTGNAVNIYGSLNAFVINTRKIDPSASGIAKTVFTAKNHQSQFQPAELYPRLIFTNGSSSNADQLAESNTTNNYYNRIQRVEGIWVIAVRSDASTDRSRSEFYDFHIRSCWYGPGQDNISTISTIVRLYNPDFVK